MYPASFSKDELQAMIAYERCKDKGEPWHMTGKGDSGFATIVGESPTSPAKPCKGYTKA